MRALAKPPHSLESQPHTPRHCSSHA
jgi:hypothetical protein